MLPEDYEVLKVFNNNVILVMHIDKEKIIIKKGIGFNKVTGSIIAKDTNFEKVFTIESSDVASKFNQLVTRIDDSIVGLCEEIISMISSEIKEPLDEGIHVRLIDHIAFTLHRIKNNDMITNPFTVEIETLYPREMEISIKAIAILENSTGLHIPDDEAGFIALHIHSAKNKGKLSNSIKYAYLCNTLVDFIEDELGIAIDRKSIDSARFISHIRFALERIIKNIPIKNELLSSIKRKCTHSYTIAKKVAKIIEEELSIKVSDEEKGYIAMHIERIRNVSNYAGC